MLGDNCPHGCNVPLMRSRDKKSLVCLGCDTDFLANIPAENGPLKAEQPLKIEKMSTNFGTIVDSKLSWVMGKIEKSISTAELSELVDLASKLVALKNSVYPI